MAQETRRFILTSRRSFAAVAVLGALALGACGRAGPLEAPPDPNAVKKEDTSGNPLQSSPKPKPIVPPKTPFFMDPLL